MRSIVLLAIALLNATASAQPAPSRPVDVLAEGLAVCRAMFAARHPLPAGFSEDLNLKQPAGEVLQEWGSMAGLKHPSFDELHAAGWVWPQTPRSERAGTLRVTKGGAWGRALLTVTGANCSISLSASDSRVPGGPELIAAAETWISQTYPAALRDEPTISPPQDYLGERRVLTRTTWRAPDTMRVSLMVGHVGSDTRPVSFYMAVSYSPRLPRPAPPAPIPPT